MRFTIYDSQARDFAPSNMIDINLLYEGRRENCEIIEMLDLTNNRALRSRVESSRVDVVVVKLKNTIKIRRAISITQFRIYFPFYNQNRNRQHSENVQ